MSLGVASFPKTHEDFHFAGVGLREVRIVNQEFSLIGGSDSQSNLVGTWATALRRVLQLVEMVALSDATVLLLDETGTGKELIARAIHERSQRHKEDFVTLHCAAIPVRCLRVNYSVTNEALSPVCTAEGWPARVGGSRHVVLDEVGDMPLELQPKLLRALQERVYERVGSAHTKKVDVRLVAATNCDLEPMMEQTRKYSIAGPTFHAEVRAAYGKVRRYDSVCCDRKADALVVAGNVRELENMIERS